MMTIYDWHTGPYPARVRIALGELDLQSEVRFVSIDLWKGEHKTAAFLAKNYSGTLPVLELNDGTLIAECTAITQYLDALSGSPVLTGTTPVEPSRSRRPRPGRVRRGSSRRPSASTTSTSRNATARCQSRFRAASGWRPRAG